MFLEISQNSQENTCEFWEISKNIFFHKTPVVAASVCTERFWTIAGLKIPILMKTKPNSNATADAETP